MNKKMPCFICYVSLIMCQMSGITCHISILNSTGYKVSQNIIYIEYLLSIFFLLLKEGLKFAFSPVPLSFKMLRLIGLNHGQSKSLNNRRT